MLWNNYIIGCNSLSQSVNIWPLLVIIGLSDKACSNLIYWWQSVNCWSNLSSHTRPLSFTAIVSAKVSVTDPLSSVLDDVLRLDKTLFTDGGVLIVDQICLVIPGPRRFPDEGLVTHQSQQLTLDEYYLILYRYSSLVHFSFLTNHRC